MVGGAKESERSEGKKQISGALWGLLLAFGAWLILYTINPELIKLNFALPTGDQPEMKFEGGKGGEFKGSGTSGTF